MSRLGSVWDAACSGSEAMQLWRLLRFGGSWWIPGDVTKTLHGYDGYDCHQSLWMVAFKTGQFFRDLRQNL